MTSSCEVARGTAWRTGRNTGHALGALVAAARILAGVTSGVRRSQQQTSAHGTHPRPAEGTETKMSGVQVPPHKL